MDSVALYRSDMRRIRNKKRRQRQLKRNITVGIIVCILVVALSVAFGSILVHAQSEDIAPVYKYYASIEVQYGETLWSIAQKNLDNEHYADTQTYIKEVLRINHLTDEQIVAGQYLIIPYYSSEFVG